VWVIVTNTNLVGLGVDLDGNSREALAVDPHAGDAILVANVALLHVTLLAPWRARRPSGQT